jgi:hypothetical protein
MKRCTNKTQRKQSKTSIVKDIGMGHRIERKTPWLSPDYKAARLKLAKEHIDWGFKEWSHIAFSDEMMLQTRANSKKVYVWRYPEEEYLEDCCGATVISGFEKIKIWGAMRYGKLSELIIMPEKNGGGKLTAIEYTEVILDREIFDFWIEGMEDVGYLLIMKDGAPYHRGAATMRRKQLEKDGWIGWEPGT